MDSKTHTRDGAVVARQTVNLSVLGSNPSREKPAGSKTPNRHDSQVWSTGLVLRTNAFCFVGSNPARAMPRGHKTQPPTCPSGSRGPTQDRLDVRLRRFEPCRWYTGRMVKWKSLLTSNQLFRVRSPVRLPGPVI